MADQFPMPTPTVPNKPLKTFKSLSFDIYGTLIDWENSITSRLSPLTPQIPTSSPHKNAAPNLGELFHTHEVAVQAESPDMRYNEVLSQAYLRLASQLQIPGTEKLEAEARDFGNGVGDWPAFPDTVDVMNRLGKYYKLIVLSNVDKESFSRTNAGPLKGLKFWRVYTAQDIGSYKPDLRNFEFLLKGIADAGGIGKDEDLHVAQSLFHDHVPAKKMGMSSVWINRRGIGEGSLTGGGKEFKRMHESGEVGYGWRFATLGEFADEVERQWGEKASE